MKRCYIKLFFPSKLWRGNELVFQDYGRRNSVRRLIPNRPDNVRRLRIINTHQRTTIQYLCDYARRLE